MIGFPPDGSENQKVITRLPAWSPVVSAEPPNSGPKLETQRSLELLNHIAGKHVGWWSEHPSSSSLKSDI